MDFVVAFPAVPFSEKHGRLQFRRLFGRGVLTVPDPCNILAVAGVSLGPDILQGPGSIHIEDKISPRFEELLNFSKGPVEVVLEGKVVQAVVEAGYEVEFSVHLRKLDFRHDLLI